MNGFRYDTFENHSELSEMIKKNKAKSVVYMSQPDQWDLHVPKFGRKKLKV